MIGFVIYTVAFVGSPKSSVIPITIIEFELKLNSLWRIFWVQINMSEEDVAFIYS